MWTRAWAVVALAGLGWVACDSPTGSGTAEPRGSRPFGPEHFLDGKVTDSSGNPVVGASISLVYSLESDQPFAVPTLLGGSQPWEPAELDDIVYRYEVLDYTRESVRVLVDNPEGLPVAPALWDSRDDDGNLVPNGVYILRLVMGKSGGGRFVVEHKVLVQVEDPGDLLDRRHALTDEGGHFRISMRLLPIGEGFTTTDESGSAGAHILITRTVHVYAIRRVGAEVVSTHVDTSVRLRKASIHVYLTLP